MSGLCGCEKGSIRMQNDTITSMLHTYASRAMSNDYIIVLQRECNSFPMALSSAKEGIYVGMIKSTINIAPKFRIFYIICSNICLSSGVS